MVKVLKTIVILLSKKIAPTKVGKLFLRSGYILIALFSQELKDSKGTVHKIMEAAENYAP